MAPKTPSISREFADYCCELLAGAGPCAARRMFGGWGISTDGLTLAIIADLGGGERLYLKASEETRPRFEAAGCARFVYQAKGRAMGMNYYSAPEDAMESAPAMAPWARLALESALKARISGVKRSHNATPSTALKRAVAPRGPRKSAPG
jgi:DNA transformation protein